MKIKSDFNLHMKLPFYREKFNHKMFCYSFLLVFLSILLLYSIQCKNTKDIQEGIASEIIRFHVIANSDSTEDQVLKMKVKEALTDSLRPTLEQAKSKEEARILLKKKLNSMETLSNKIIKENGFTYTAKASLEQGYFPLKVYGDLSLPPGKYEAVRIELGSGVGQNWWCIMYPPLCFVDGTYSVVPEPSKRQLKYLLTDEEYNSLFMKKNVKVKIKFKILTHLNKLIKE